MDAGLAESASEPASASESESASASTSEPESASASESESESEPASESESESEPEFAPTDPFAGRDHTGTPPLPSRAGALPPPDLAWTPDYDGRAEPTRAEDVLVWVPRGLLLPVHLALEYLVRLPIRTAIAAGEENHVFERAVDLFTFADGDAAIFPTAFYDAGRGMWGALNMFYNNAGVEGHRVDALAGLGTNGWYTISAGDRWTLFDGGAGQFSFDGAWVHDPTQAFAGIGPRAPIDDQVFYSEEHISGDAELAVTLAGLSRIRFQTGLRRTKLDGGRAPSIGSAGSPFDPSDLNGFADPYVLASAGVAFEIDTRDPERSFTPGSGLRLEGSARFFASTDTDDLRFLRYGLRPIVFWDITGVNHVLAVSVYLQATVTTGPESLPIHELVAVGGNEYMRGFLLGRFRGESALVHALAYTWPVLFFADGLLFAELGSAFEGFFEGFGYAEMSADWGLGLRTSFSRAFGFNLLLAFGTNRLGLWDENGLEVQNVRFVVGATGAY